MTIPPQQHSSHVVISNVDTLHVATPLCNRCHKVTELRDLNMQDIIPVVSLPPSSNTERKPLNSRVVELPQSSRNDCQHRELP